MNDFSGSRVLHVGKYYPPYFGGMEQFLADLLPALRRDGIDCSAVVHDHRRSQRERAVEVKEPSNISSESDKPVVYRVPSFGQMAYAPVSPQFPVWLNRVIRKHDPHIIHLHMPNTSALWVLALSRAKKRPIVVHWHSDVVWSKEDRLLGFLYWMYRPFETALLRKASRIICTSSPYLEASAALSRWRKKCCVVPLGLGLQRVPRTVRRDREEAEKLWGDANFRVLAVGRLTYYKGHEYLLEAAKMITGARIILVGCGGRRYSLEKVAKDTGIADRVVFAGSLSSAKMHALMDTSNCVCLPSVERAEAFGLVLLEAMLHGKPTVVSDIPGSGVGWVVDNGKSGLLVPPRDANALGLALKTLMERPDMAKRMGAVGKARFERHFDIECVAKQITKIYRELT